MKKFDLIYKQLPDTLLPWYKQNARELPWRQDTEPYHVWISEIMLQQTRVEAVWAYYLRFLEQLPDIHDLAEVSESQLFKLWEGLVDGNVLRIITRMTENDAPIDRMQTKTEIAAQLEKVYPKNNCGQFTQALMELGATICTPKSPKCTECPANGFCRAYANGTMLLYPVKQPKKDKRLENRTVFLLQCGEQYAITKRTESGLLSGLWQLPNVLGEMDVNHALNTADTFGVQPVELYKQMHRVHIFTHIKWQMTCYHILCANKTSDFVWATAQELQTDYALHSVCFLNSLTKPMKQKAVDK